MTEDAPQKWDYAMLHAGFVNWETIAKPKHRAELGLDPETDWEKLREDHADETRAYGDPRFRNRTLGGVNGVWVARYAADGRLRPLLAVLRELGLNGWEVAGVQTTGLYTSEYSAWYHPSSSFVLKRPLPGSRE